MNRLAALPSPLSTYWDWQLHAACRGMDVAVFFQPDFARGSIKRAQETRAKAVCATCLVQHQCLDWAVTVNEPFGVWGGMTPEQRKELAPGPAAEAEAEAEAEA